MKEILIKPHVEGLTPVKILPNGDWIDLYTAEEVTLKQGESRLISLGVSMQLPENYEAHLAARSSTFKRWGVLQTNAVGVIDNSYCGDNDIWKFAVYATRDVTIPFNTAIAQFRIMKKQPSVMFSYVDQLGNDDRGGFGSTDEKEASVKKDLTEIITISLDDCYQENYQYLDKATDNTITMNMMMARKIPVYIASADSEPMTSPIGYVMNSKLDWKTEGISVRVDADKMKRLRQFVPKNVNVKGALKGNPYTLSPIFKKADGLPYGCLTGFYFTPYEVAPGDGRFIVDLPVKCTDPYTGFLDTMRPDIVNDLYSEYTTVLVEWVTDPPINEILTAEMMVYRILSDQEVRRFEHMRGYVSSLFVERLIMDGFDPSTSAFALNFGEKNSGYPDGRIASKYIFRVCENVVSSYERKLLYPWERFEY